MSADGHEIAGFAAHTQRFEGGWSSEGLADDAALECGVCWRVYDPQAGDPETEVAPGTPFSQLPDHWRCPECDSEKQKFLLIADGVGPRRGAEAPTLQARVDDLLHAYRDADLAMRALPIYNPRLKIAAFGFRADGAAIVGALVTPWFINIVRLPKDKGRDARASGAVRAVTFPSGAYLFSAYKLDRVGAFEACSLFSPVLEFESQEAARIAAGAALDALYAPAASAAAAVAPDVNALSAQEKSRRTLLFGRTRPGA